MFFGFVKDQKKCLFVAYNYVLGNKHVLSNQAYKKGLEKYFVRNFSLQEIWIGISKYNLK